MEALLSSYWTEDAGDVQRKMWCVVLMVAQAALLFVFSHVEESYSAAH